MKNFVHSIRRCMWVVLERKKTEKIASWTDERFTLHLLRMSTKRRIEDLYEDPQACAKAIGLHYVTNLSNGIRRMKSGKGFHYVHHAGQPVRDGAVLKRIRSLVIPPAWTDVCICASPSGHLQATGRDARGRKQYRYHPQWNRMRNITKYHRMAAFANLLPKVRQRVAHDLRRKGMPREKVLATVVQLLEKTLIRVGNDEYAKSNGSYGLTTMHNNHVIINGPTILFHFKGKSGVTHTIDLTNSRLATIIHQCQEIPGKQLFSYRDADGKPQNISSDDVNAYLQEVMGDDFTAKDYRTWQGTVLAASTLKDCQPCTNEKEERTVIAKAIQSVAERLGNTPTVCRKYYIHPDVLKAFRDGTLPSLFDHPKKMRHLKADECAVLALFHGAH